MTTSTKSALDRLEELRQAVRDAEAQVEEAQIERRKVARGLDRVVAPLRSYHEDLAAGDREPDAALERKLTKAVHEVESGALVRLEPVFGRGGVVSDMRVIDERVEARVAGAQRLVQTRLNEVSAFVRDHRVELQAELLEQAEAARDGLHEAWEALQRAAGDWSRVRGEFSRVLPSWAISEAELPPHPLAGATQEIERAFSPVMSGQPRDPRRLVPAPASLLEEEEDDDG